MKNVNLLLILLIVALTTMGCVNPSPTSSPASETALTPTPTPTPVSPPAAATGETVKLPEPNLKGSVSVEETLFKRRSIREYADAPLTLEEISQLLWAAQGITSGWGGRTAPSAGATYPLELYLVVGNVQNLSPGIYKYKPQGHELIKVKDSDVRKELAGACLRQDWVEQCAVDIVIATVYERTTRRYGDRGIRYVHIEVGHTAQNICLEAVALGLSTVPVGAFQDDSVKNVIGLPANEVPIYVIPVGREP